MKIFVIWIIIIGVIVAIYLRRLYRRSARGFRFQVKLTLVFFLLVLVPAIPLTFFISDFLTRGVQLFPLPGTEHSLAQALDIIKYQLEQRGKSFLIAHSDDSFITENLLEKYGMLYYAQVQWIGHPPQLFNLVGPAIHHYQQSPLNQKSEQIFSIASGEISSNLYFSSNQTICEVYQLADSGMIRVIAFPVDSMVVAAKENITESLRLHDSLSLFKETLVEGQIIWGLATIYIMILTLLAVFTAKRLSQGISQPIRALVDGMQRIAAGDLTHQVHARANDEIKFLIDAFNQMTVDLKNSQTKLVEAERLAAWQGIARRVSHEIKNMLTPIQLSLRRLAGPIDSEAPSPKDRALATIDEELASLHRLAEAFSEFAQMPPAHPQLDDINDIIGNLVKLIEGEPNGMRIKLSLDETCPKILLDRQQIRRALHNLIKNSIEASKVGSEIIIETHHIAAGGYSVKIVIKDHGTGIPPEMQNRIFEPYFTTKPRGMGLGLSIVKRIIEDHHGHIEITSIQGQGTEVSVYLP
ncbi:MAG: ATP-binding protein [candidate division KSB1 bacterium]|nr:ATP-binding protein [candidate division KSB1 bacterium]MDZ7336525.1 ATP-binding protein [candidate division KSB1 bacterium]MDZ7358596.1 ATP-binding protein [candidate division KSB1 bacterium]MDZ7401822.1 ATP-binding protein [candidate division KSB1 bacterium]